MCMTNSFRSLAPWTCALLLSAAAAGCGGSGNNNSDGGTSGCTPFGGVCLFAPAQTAQRTKCGDVTEFCDKAAAGAPNLACVATPIDPPDGPTSVTLTGFVHVFSSGPNSDGLQVSIYDAAPLLAGTDINAATPLAQGVFALDPKTQRACDTDKVNGCSIPVSSACTLPVCNDGIDGRTDDKKYCMNNGASPATCNDRLRWEARYTFANIPTNRQLAVRVTGPEGKANQVWATTVQWNLYLPTGTRSCVDENDIDCMDLTNASAIQYRYNVNALSQSDYVNIPQTSGLSGGISAGLGAIAGEVHDCDNVRVGNVAVGTNPAGDRFTYFNGNPVKTLPDSARYAFGTDQLGLYAAFNLKPGKVNAQAAGILELGGAMVDFGNFEGIVYPDTVSVININGGRPKP